MFELGGHGDLLPVAVEKNKEKVNLVVYGVMAEGKVLYVTLINREYGSKGRAAKVELELGKMVEKVETITMSQRDGNIAQVGGVMVGGEEIGEDGKWAGGWKDLGKEVNGTKVTVGMPSASATILRFVIK